MPARIVAPEVRSCETCGVQFEVGGRGRPPRRQRFCSQKCHAKPRAIDRSRICPVCGKTFIPGTRGAVGRSRRWCSRDCAGIGSIHPSNIHELTVSEAAYLAGLLDGEGSIFLHGHRPGSPRQNLRVLITNTSVPMLDWLMATVGGKLNAKQATALTRVPAWSWVVNGQNAVNVLNQTVPYLITKRDKALTAIESQPTLPM